MIKDNDLLNSKRRDLAKDLSIWIAENKDSLFVGEKPSENLIDAIELAVKNYDRDNKQGIEGGE